MANYKLGKGRLSIVDPDGTETPYADVTSLDIETIDISVVGEEVRQKAIVQTPFGRLSFPGLPEKPVEFAKTFSATIPFKMEPYQIAALNRMMGMGPIRTPKGVGFKTMTYIGPSSHLQGKLALVIINHNNRKAYAQFSDFDTKKSHGWWPFSINSFIVQTRNPLKSETAKMHFTDYDL